MMIKLSCNCHVAADQISEITVSDYGHITVRMKDGAGTVCVRHGKAKKKVGPTWVPLRCSERGTASGGNR